MDLRKLEIFVAVVETGSFSGASERLFMTQSAVSQHIQELEASLGTSLFIRGRRGVQLTSAGETLADYAKGILKLVNEARLAVTNVERLQGGHLRLGATPGVGDYLLPEWIQPFRQRHPKLSISLMTDVTAAMIARLLDKNLDLAFVEGELDTNPHLECLMLLEVPQLLIVGSQHPWAKLDRIPIAALQEQPFVMRHAKSQTRRWLEDTMRQHNLQLHIAAEFDSPAAIKQAVIAGMGVTILPDYVIRHEQNLGLIKALTFEDALLQRTLKLIWDKREGFTPVTHAFLTQFAGVFPQILKLLQR